MFVDTSWILSQAVSTIFYNNAIPHNNINQRQPSSEQQRPAMG